MFAKYLKNTIERVNLLVKYTKNELHPSISQDFAWAISYIFRFLGILRTLILQNSLQLASTGCQGSLVKSTQHATLLLKVALL